MGIAPLPSLSLCTGGFEPSSPLPHTPSACAPPERPCERLRACGLASFLRGVLASLRSLCLRPLCKYMRARRLAPFRDPKISDRLASLIEAMLDVGGCDSRVHGPGQVGGCELSLTPPPQLVSRLFWCGLRIRYCLSSHRPSPSIRLSFCQRTG